LITFKSKASANILMLEKHALIIFKLLKKNPKRDVITFEEIPRAIEIFENQFEKENSEDCQPEDIFSENNDNKHSIPFAIRFFPFFQMLNSAKKTKQNIYWGY